MTSHSSIFSNSSCRICLKSNDDVNLLPLFSENDNYYDSLTKADLMMKCSSVQIMKDDGLPQKICKYCSSLLLQSYDFKILCENSDKVLHEQIKIEVKIKGDENDKNNLISEKILYECRTCKSQFVNKTLYLQHMKNCREIKVSRKLPKKRKSKQTLKKDVNGGKMNALTVCHDSLSESNGLEESQNSYIDESHSIDLQESDLQQCPTCLQHFSNIHVHQYLDHRQNKCQTCGKCFKKLRFYLQHLRSNVCRAKETKHLCPDCGHGFKELGNLKVHMRIHTGEKPYQCEFCKKGFAQWSSLKSHRVIHTGEKNYACEICGKTFSRKITLNKHLTSHSDERNFTCDICNKNFKHSRTVKEHMVIHTGIKNFKCEFCGKAFGFRKNLVVHRRTHTGDKPYVCELCNQAFTQRHCLRTHTATHHKNNVLEKT